MSIGAVVADAIPGCAGCLVAVGMAASFDVVAVVVGVLVVAPADEPVVDQSVVVVIFV